MALHIKDSAVTDSPTRITKESNFYTPFPSNEQVTFNEKQLLPLGLLSTTKLAQDDKDNILIAMPISMAIFDGDVPYIAYSLTDHGWQVDASYLESLSDDFESYGEYYQKAASFYKEHTFLNMSLNEAEEGEPLFEFGGQPELGCNWDAYLWDEESDDETRYFDAMDEESGDNYDHYATREIGFLDEQSGVDFSYLGTFSFSIYVDGGGEAIVFYSAKHKKVLIIAEFS